MNKEALEKAIEFSIKQVDKILLVSDTTYPAPNSENNVYEMTANYGWTTGFWTGMLWLAYQFSNDEKYRNAALKQVDDFYSRISNKIDVDHHDMGFLYSPSCVSAYKITGSETAKNAAIMAADQLCARFQEKGQFIQAWGAMGEADNYRLIIDCLMNIPLLFWAEKVTGNTEYRRIAQAHLNTAVSVVIRDDYSTHHTYFFNKETGLPDHGETAQGYSDSSIWARGQAWGIYGIALGYRHTHDEKLIKKFINVTKVFLDHLPEDDIPAWDMIFTDKETQKDSSAAAIAVCGILEMAKQCDFEEKEYFIRKADDMMNALHRDYYVEDSVPAPTGILKHAVYAFHGNCGVDECNIWGDYYYMEALMRLTNPDWDSYWE